MIILYTVEKGPNGTKFYGTIEPNISDMLIGNRKWTKPLKKFFNYYGI